MSFNSKYTGEEVEALLDKVSDGSVGGDTFNMGTEVKSIDELSPHVNLLTNPLFENDFEDWTINPDYVSLSAEGETFQGRRYAICSYNGSSREEYFCSKAYTADASGNYTISAWVNDINATGRCYICYWIDGSSSSSQQTYSIESATWTFLTWTISLEKGQTVQIGVFPYRNNTQLGVCMPKLEYGDTATAFTDSYLESSGGTALEYYHEEEDLAEINAPIIDLYGANVVIQSHTDTDDVRIQAGASDPSKFCVGPKNIELLPSESKEGKALYNNKEIATVDDVHIVSVGERNLLTNSQFDGNEGWTGWASDLPYVTLADEKFNGWNVLKLYFSNAAYESISQKISIEEGKYYKFSCWAKSDGTGRVQIYQGGSLQFISSENTNYMGEDWSLITIIMKAASTTSSSVSIANYPAGMGVTCDVYISMPTFEEISEMAAVEDKFADVITLDTLRQTYPSETLVSMLGYWFTSGESSNITAAQIMDYDEELQTARIRFKYSTGSTQVRYLQILCSTTTTGTYTPIFNASPQTYDETGMIIYFDLIVPCDSGSLKSIDGYQYRLSLSSL